MSSSRRIRSAGPPSSPLSAAAAAAATTLPGDGSGGGGKRGLTPGSQGGAAFAGNPGGPGEVAVAALPVTELQRKGGPHRRPLRCALLTAGGGGGGGGGGFLEEVPAAAATAAGWVAPPRGARPASQRDANLLAEEQAVSGEGRKLKDPSATQAPAVQPPTAQEDATCSDAELGPLWFARMHRDDTHPAYIFCPLFKHFAGGHPTHSLDEVVAALRTSPLPECRCRPDLNAPRAPREHEVVTACRDRSCVGVFRVVTHPRHGHGGPARNNGPGASMVVLRPQRSWEVELGVTETRKLRFKGAQSVLRLYLLYSFCKKKQTESREARGVAVAAAFLKVAEVVNVPLRLRAMSSVQASSMCHKDGDIIVPYAHS